MKKNGFLFSVLILTSTGILVKILGMINKIVVTRIVQEEGMILYSLVNPTIFLFIGLADFGFTIAISKLISENKIKKKYSEKTILGNACIFSCFIAVILICILILSVKTIANVLHEPLAIYPILSIVLLLPLCGITAILKGYFLGQKEIKYTSLSNVFEQIIRFLFSILLVYYLHPLGVLYSITAYFFVLTLGEVASLIYLLLKLKKHELGKFRYDYPLIKTVVFTSVPLTLNRIINSLVHFIEPILLTLILRRFLIDENTIKLEYTAISTYAIGMLSMFSFISFSISQAMMPNTTALYAKGDIPGLRKLTGRAIVYSLIPNLFMLIILFFYASEYLSLIFSTTLGSNYIKLMAPFFILFYLEGPFANVLVSTHQEKKILEITFFSSMIKLITLVIILMIPNINNYALVASIIVNIIVTFLMYFCAVKKTIEIKTDYVLIGKFVVISVILFFYISLIQKLNYLVVSLLSGIVYILLLIGFDIIKKELHSLRNK